MTTHALPQRSALALLSAAAIAGCSGGGDATTSAETTLSGLAANGQPMGGAALDAKCRIGADLATITAIDGSFSLTLSAGQKLPCMLRVSTPAATLYGYSATGGRVNLTPFTELALARGVNGDPATAFADFTAARGESISGALVAAEAYLLGEIATLLGSGPSTDLLTGAFKIGDADDRLLESLANATRAAGKTLADLVLAATTGASLKAVLTGPLAGSSGLYSGVTAQATATFLALLPTACAKSAPVTASTTLYFKCRQDSSSPSMNLVAAMWFGGLPHHSGGPIVSGPSTATAKVDITKSVADVAAGDGCSVAILEPFIPLVAAQVRGAAWSGVGAGQFSLNGGDNDSILVDNERRVHQYSMTNGPVGAIKLSVFPNRALDEPTASGSKAYVGPYTAGNDFSGYFGCRD